MKALSEQGVREVVLLGQNVNGYHDISFMARKNATKAVPTSVAGNPSDHYLSSKQEEAESNKMMMTDPPLSRVYKSTAGFSNLFHSRVKAIAGVRFADLLRDVAAINPEMRVRFTSPHPKGEYI